MKFHQTIKVQNEVISKDSPTFIIAEAGVNHGGDMTIAKKLIDLAADSGANAIKFQAFKTENLILKNVEKASYQKEATDNNESQFNMLKRLEVSKDQNLELKKYCQEKNIIFLTTPFDEETLNEIDDLDLAAYKVSSTDTTNLPFLKKIAKKGKPIFLSTGMSYLSEVRAALKTLFEHNKDVVLLQCTANYPIKDSEANLSVINTYKDNFEILLGYSDHSVGIGAAPFSIPMGVKVVEKHFTIDKSLEGPDHAASLSPREFLEFVKVVRRIDQYMGCPIKQPSASEMNTRKSLQKCLVASKDIKKGDLFSEDNIIGKRTGGIGISPLLYEELVGKKAMVNFKKNEILKIE